MTAALDNNSFLLNKAVGSEGHCEPSAVIVRDGNTTGTLFAWDGDRWIVTDLDRQKFSGFFDRLAVVTLTDGEPDDGLNQASLAVDLEVTDGEWVVNAEDLDDLRETYGESLVVVWEQE